jgi:hypothetical protein
MDWSRGRQVIQSLMQIMCLPAPVGDREETIQNNPKISPAKSGEFWTRLCLSRSCFLSHQPITEQPQTRETKILPEQMRRLGFPLTPLTKNSPPRKRETHPKNPSLSVARTRGERGRSPFSALDSQPLGSPGATFFKGRIEKRERRFDQGEGRKEMGGKCRRILLPVTGWL